MKIKNYKVITGQIECVTGLHIGGSADQIDIGGVDLPIIKHPINGEPYIPGSSLKGKIRSQLEKRSMDELLNRIETELAKSTDVKKKKDLSQAKSQLNSGEPCGCGIKGCLICAVFGAHKNTNHQLGSTRILVRDAKLSDETKKEYSDMMASSGASYIEKKVENIVNRKTGTAEHPRSQERVPSGARFDFEIVLQIADNDNESALIDFVKKGLKEVEMTYLGGYGSRGSGQVKFDRLKLDNQPFTL